MNITDTAAAAAVALTCTPSWDTNDPTAAGFITVATSVSTVSQIRFFKRHFETALVLSYNNKVTSHYRSSMNISIADISYRKEILVYTTSRTLYSTLRKCNNKCRKEWKRFRNLMHKSIQNRKEKPLCYQTAG